MRLPIIIILKSRPNRIYFFNLLSLTTVYIVKIVNIPHLKIKKLDCLK